MNALVLDASALVFSFTEVGPAAETARSRIADEQCHAPHLLDAEVGSVARSKVFRGELSTERALALIETAPRIVTRRYQHGPLARMAWSLRANVSYYDALYVALAAALDLPLVTCDARLASAPSLPCAVELISSPPAPGRARPS